MKFRFNTCSLIEMIRSMELLSKKVSHMSKYRYDFSELSPTAYILRELSFQGRGMSTPMNSTLIERAFVKCRLN